MVDNYIDKIQPQLQFQIVNKKNHVFTCYFAGWVCIVVIISTVSMRKLWHRPQVIEGSFHLANNNPLTFILSISAVKVYSQLTFEDV